MQLCLLCFWFQIFIFIHDWRVKTILTVLARSTWQTLTDRSGATYLGDQVLRETITGCLRVLIEKNKGDKRVFQLSTNPLQQRG